MTPLLTGYAALRTGLLGRRLAHSLSPQIHAYLADYPYDLIEREPEDVENFLIRESYDAFNVTIPYKKTVLPYLAEVSEEARAIGAVNTVVRTARGLLGHNTDYYGFSCMLNRAGIDPYGAKVLVLGTGGASLTVHAVLKDMRAGEAVEISRTGENNYTNLTRHADADLIVNTTPVGMYPDCGHAPLTLDGFPRLRGVLDLIYNPRRTALLMDAAARGIPCADGLSMLTAQAIRACELFTAVRMPDGADDIVYRGISRGMTNLVLIGMPGCGKSTVGRLLADTLGRELLDTDVLIEQAAGIPTRVLLERDGEACFRELEHAVLCGAGARLGNVIATGGGVVTRRENLAPLKQNGVVIFLDRAPDRLQTEGRPLTIRHGVEALYRQRLPFYRMFADATVDANGSPEETAANVLRIWENMT